MASSGSAKPKPENTSRERKDLIYNMVKSDGRFKEVIHLQELARETWDTNWGFMKSDFINKIYEEEAELRGLDKDFMVRRRHKRIQKDLKCTSSLIKSPPVPPLSSGMVGWRSSNWKCTLEIAGPLYTSPVDTIDPPRCPEDLPLKQTYIHLG